MGSKPSKVEREADDPSAVSDPNQNEQKDIQLAINQAHTNENVLHKHSANVPQKTNMPSQQEPLVEESSKEDALKAIEAAMKRETPAERRARERQDENEDNKVDRFRGGGFGRTDGKKTAVNVPFWEADTDWGLGDTKFEKADIKQGVRNFDNDKFRKINNLEAEKVTTPQDALDDLGVDKFDKRSKRAKQVPGGISTRAIADDSFDDLLDSVLDTPHKGNTKATRFDLAEKYLLDSPSSSTKMGASIPSVITESFPSPIDSMEKYLLDSPLNSTKKDTGSAAGTSDSSNNAYGRGIGHHASAINAQFFNTGTSFGSATTTLGLEKQTGKHTSGEPNRDREFKSNPSWGIDKEKQLDDLDEDLMEMILGGN